MRLIESLNYGIWLKIKRFEVRMAVTVNITVFWDCLVELTLLS